MNAAATASTADPATRPTADVLGLCLVSALILFLELACIRWLSSHVLYLTFFTNVILLASFLGMSAGCLAASRRGSLLRATPLYLLLLVATGIGTEQAGDILRRTLDVGKQASPQLVYFGTEPASGDVTAALLPMEVIAAAFFLLTALAFLGPGQLLGRLLARHPRRVHAYLWNLAGSCLGIAAFTGASWLSLPPPAWFGPVAVLLAWLLRREGHPLLSWRGLCLAGVVAATTLGAGGRSIWSPYYRIDYDPVGLKISVNLIGHQGMVPKSHPASAYAMPHLLRQDSGGTPFRDVLVIGAGSGNDVGRALQWGSERVDAVEIDPKIQGLGKNHPDRPYADPRVRAIVDDGRHFLRATGHSYDLVVYALVDSLVLHAGVSSLRLESFLFTREAFADARARLGPGGVLAVYNFFRQGWIVGRLASALEEVFGEPPVVLCFPPRATLSEEDGGGFTLLLAGDTAAIRTAFHARGFYAIPSGVAPEPGGPDGFGRRIPGAVELVPAAVQMKEPARIPTDDWPQLYLRKPRVPALMLRGMGLMLALSIAVLWWAAPRQAGSGLGPTMFLLGAGFMLVETGAITQMALLLGSTWIVNALVILAILGMSIAGALVCAFRLPARSSPWVAGLLLTLALRLLLPLQAFLGLPRAAAIPLASLQVFLPIFFAGVLFTQALARSSAPDRDFGWNIAGAMTGGLLEHLSLVFGYSGLAILAMALYAAAGVAGMNRRSGRAGG